MDREAELERLRSQKLSIEEEIAALEQSPWYDSGCTIDEDAEAWEASARHWGEDDSDWYSSSC